MPAMTETEAAWESAIYNAERARKAEEENTRLRAELAECRKALSALLKDAEGLLSEYSHAREADGWDRVDEDASFIDARAIIGKARKGEEAEL